MYIYICIIMMIIIIIVIILVIITIVIIIIIIYIYICLYTYIYHRYTSIYSVERCLCSVYCCSGAVAAKRGQIIAPWLWCLHSSEARCQRCQRCCLGRPIYMLKSIEKLMWKSWTRNGSLTCYQWFARQWNCSSFTCNMCIFDICISRK
jgi:hypothetical protein